MHSDPASYITACAFLYWQHFHIFNCVLGLGQNLKPTLSLLGLLECDCKIQKGRKARKEGRRGREGNKKEENKGSRERDGRKDKEARKERENTDVHIHFNLR